MAVGRQDDTIIVKWFPGETNGVDGSGVTVSSSPTTSNAEELDAATVILDGRVDTLSARIVASGVLPTGV